MQVGRKLCSVAYTCSCAAQKVSLHQAATRSIGTHASSVMHAGWKCAGGWAERPGRSRGGIYPALRAPASNLISSF